MKMLDLDEILAIADGYADRMKIVREYFDKREPIPEKYKQYLSVLDHEDAVKAFEALRPLAMRIKELEKQRRILAGKISDMGHDSDVMPSCALCEFSGYCERNCSDCGDAIIHWVEKISHQNF